MHKHLYSATFSPTSQTFRQKNQTRGHKFKLFANNSNFSSTIQTFRQKIQTFRENVKLSTNMSSPLWGLRGAPSRRFQTFMIAPQQSQWAFSSRTPGPQAPHGWQMGSLGDSLSSAIIHKISQSFTKNFKLLAKNLNLWLGVGWGGEGSSQEFRSFNYPLSQSQ